MHRQSQEEVASAARRRLELLGRELDQAGLRRVDDLVEVDHGDHDGSPAALPESATVSPAGRHLRPPRPGLTRRLAGWVGDQVPETLRGRAGLDPGPVLLVVALVALAVTATVYVVLRMGGDAEAVPLRPELPLSSGSASPLASLPSVNSGANPGANPTGAGSGPTGL